jgi:hypothetical protein
MIRQRLAVHRSMPATTRCCLTPLEIVQHDPYVLHRPLGAILKVHFQTVKGGQKNVPVSVFK